MPKSLAKLLTGGYLSLLNLLNELGKRDKMRGSPSILSLFRNEFNKFIGILGQVWCLIVSIPDLCPLSHFSTRQTQLIWFCTSCPAIHTKIIIESKLLTVK